MAQVISRSCQVCGGMGRGTKPLAAYTVSRWPVVECPSCGFVYLAEAPTYDALKDEEAWEKNHAKEMARRKRQLLYRLDYATRFRLRIGKAIENSRMRRVIGRSGRVLDIGCGGGVRVPDGLIPFGIEISDRLAELAGPQFMQRGGSVYHGPALDGLDSFTDSFFSAILMRSYLEHEVEPRAVLEKAFRKLAPRGKVLVKVPNYGSVNRRLMGANWCGFRFPDHVNYFSSQTLGRLARSIGFRYSGRNVVPAIDDNLYVVLEKPA